MLFSLKRKEPKETFCPGKFHFPGEENSGGSDNPRNTGKEPYHMERTSKQRAQHRGSVFSLFILPLAQPLAPGVPRGGRQRRGAEHVRAGHEQNFRLVRVYLYAVDRLCARYFFRSAVSVRRSARRARTFLCPGRRRSRAERKDARKSAVPIGSKREKVLKTLLSF